MGEETIPGTEALGETPEVETTDKTVTHNGQDYTVPADVLDNVEVIEAWEDGKHTLLLRALLGPVQWDKFKRTKPGLLEVYELINKVLEASGEGE